MPGLELAPALPVGVMLEGAAALKLWLCAEATLDGLEPPLPVGVTLEGAAAFELGL